MGIKSNADDKVGISELSVKENKKNFFSFLLLITLVSSVFSGVFFLVTTFAHYDSYLSQWDGCGNWFFSYDGPGSICDLVEKYGPDKVHLTHLFTSLMVVITNVMDIIAAIRMKMGKNDGFRIYTVALYIYLGAGFWVLVKLQEPSHVLVSGGSALLYYFLLKSCLQAEENRQ